jgi:hypothetical protein
LLQAAVAPNAAEATLAETNMAITRRIRSKEGARIAAGTLLRRGLPREQTQPPLASEHNPY